MFPVITHYCLIMPQSTSLSLFPHQEPNESAVSEWSLRTQNQHIPSMMLPTEAEGEDELGRASVYFKAKSKDMGNLSGGSASTRVS